MKRVVIFLLSIFLFTNVVYADPHYCYISKEPNENVILKHGDEIKVYFTDNFYDSLLKAKFKLYYDPYIFEIVKNDNDEYVFHDDFVSIKNVKVYSSIIEFNVEGSENIELDYPKIYVKFKVKDTAKDGKTIIELINNSSSITTIYEGNFYSDDVGEFTKIDTTDVDCFNAKLYYKIDNKSDEVLLDSTYSYIGVPFEGAYMYPNYSPDVTKYEIEVYGDELEEIALEISCAINGECDNEEYIPIDYKNTKSLKVTSRNGSKSTTYEFKINIPNYEDDEDYPILTDLKVLHYDMVEKFDEYDKVYHVIVPDTVDSLSIDYESDYDVSISGNSNFVIGENIVTISVTTKNLTNKYYIVVSKQEKEIIEEKTPDVKEEEKKNEEPVIENKPSKLMPTIIIGLILLTVLILIAVFLIKDKEENDIKG